MYERALFEQGECGVRVWRVDLDESARRSGWEIGDRGGLSMPVLFVAGKG